MQWRGEEASGWSDPFIWGILNVTPDSFSDGGRYADTVEAVDAACRMADQGADVIDVGGESTRPGARAVPDDVQIERTEPVIADLAKRFAVDGPALSIDTRSPVVARRALEAGATIVNDVSACRDPAMFSVVAEHHAGLVLMHMKGTPETMQETPQYDDLLGEITAFLDERVHAALSGGVDRQRLLIDPGIGFGKTTAHNLEILRNLDRFHALGVPLLVGPSRKRFIGGVLDLPKPSDRLIGTAAVVVACVLAGVQCLRVHDVRACREAADMAAALRS